jgi:acetylcholinesterase
MNDYPECPVLSWLPVIEPDLGQERFFIEQPKDTIAAQNFNKVPIIIGVTSDEWMSPVPKVLENVDLMKKLNENFDEIAPICFSYDANEEFSAAMRKLYFPFDKIDARSFNGLNNFFSDGIIGYGAHNFVRLISKFTPVYYYKFSFIGRSGFFKYPGDKPYGVHHGDDGMYLLPYPFLGPMIQPEDPENFMVERMTRIFSQFALTG